MPPDKAFIRNILLLVSHGMAERAVLDLPLDKFDLYVQEAQRSRLERRQDYVRDLTMVESLKGGSKEAQRDFKVTMDEWTDEITHG